MLPPFIVGSTIGRRAFITLRRLMIAVACSPDSSRIDDVKAVSLARLGPPRKAAIALSSMAFEEATTTHPSTSAQVRVLSFMMGGVGAGPAWDGLISTSGMGIAG